MGVGGRGKVGVSGGVDGELGDRGKVWVSGG